MHQIANEFFDIEGAWSATLFIYAYTSLGFVTSETEIDAIVNRFIDDINEMCAELKLDKHINKI